VRIATWNLERGGRTLAARSAQSGAIQRLAADVFVLTELPEGFKTERRMMASPARRSGGRGDESWVAIVGDDVQELDLELPFERLAVAARVNHGRQKVIVYGAVLPWLAVTSHAPYLVQPGETSFEVFQRVLREQAADIALLQRSYGEPIIWAGDFNQSLVGALNGGAAVRRELLKKTLAELGFGAWNGEASHAQAGLKAVDLICGNAATIVRGQGRIDNVCDGVVISDHAGYWVDVDVTDPA